MAETPGEEDQPMLLHPCANITKIKDVSQCTDSSETNNEPKRFCNEEDEQEEYKPAYVSNRKGLFAQYMLAIVIMLVAVLSGVPCGYTTILLPQLASENGTFYADPEYGSWIASGYSLAAATGFFTGGPMLEAIGRRGCLMFGLIPNVISWLLIGFASNLSCIMIGRVLVGVSAGLTGMPSIVLLCETADPGIRGFVASGIFSVFCFGILLAYIFGALFDWIVVAHISSVLPIVVLIALFFIPESPVWLVKKKKLEKARDALMWLRGNDIQQVNIEIAALEARINNESSKPKISLMDKIRSGASILIDPGVLKPFVIVNAFSVLESISGTYVVVTYAVELIDDISGGTMDAYLATVMIGVIRFAFSIIMTYLFLKVGRRTLGLISALGTSAACLALAAYLASIKEPSYIDNYVFALCLLVYTGANTLGLLTLPSVMTGELFPVRARGLGGGVSLFLLNIIIFFNVKSFPMMNAAIGVIGIFTFFGSFALIVAIFIYIFLPETKDRTLQEIEDYFKQDNLMWITRPRKRKNRKNQVTKA